MRGKSSLLRGLIRDREASWLNRSVILFTFNVRQHPHGLTSFFLLLRLRVKVRAELLSRHVGLNAL